MRSALAMIETRGLLAAIEATDVMLKAAEVHLLSRTLVGGGLVTILMEGDVAACKAAIDAAHSAVERLGAHLLVSSHVIPRPDDGLAVILDASAPETAPDDAPDPTPEPTDPIEPTPVPVEDVPASSKQQKAPSKVTSTDDEISDKADIDASVETRGLMDTLVDLRRLGTVKLRNLARTYDNFPIAGRAISRAKKGQLIDHFKDYYSSL